MALTENRDDRSGPGEKLLTAEQVAAGYRNHVVVDGISLDVGRGEILSVIGPNGAGKSTFLRALSAQLQLQGGRVEILGRDLCDLTPVELARREAVLLTERVRPELMSAREVVEMGRYPYTDRFGHLREEDRAAVEEAITLLSLQELADRDYNDLSDGQKQRVLIARALAQDTDVLLLDEPSSYLDIRFRLELLKLLRGLVGERGIAVVVTFHEVELALKISDRILGIRDGRVHSLGTPAELVRNGMLADLFGVDVRDPEVLELCPWLRGTDDRASVGPKPVAMIAFTRRGQETMKKLSEGLALEYPGEKIITALRMRSAPEESIPGTAEEFARRWFPGCRALIFIGAAGIAVRSIAACVRDKCTDPAVLVVDEAGHYCISLLSGHIGGGNALCRTVAGLLGAEAVITTASDLRGVFSPDSFAVEHGLVLASREDTGLLVGASGDGWTGPARGGGGPASRAGGRCMQAGTREAAKGTAARLLDGESLRYYISHEVETFLSADPDICRELSLAEGLGRTEVRSEADLVLSVRWEETDREGALYLVPPVVCVGMGCRKGVAGDEIGTALASAFGEARIFPAAISACASIDLKKDEPGLADLGRKLGVGMTWFSSKELAGVEGDFAESEFVKSVTGVGNVCERCAAALAGDACDMLLPKTVRGSVTVAAAVPGRH